MMARSKDWLDTPEDEYEEYHDDEDDELDDEAGGCICTSGKCTAYPAESIIGKNVSCPNIPTQEDLLCDECRELKGNPHCHPCDVV